MLLCYFNFTSVSIPHTSNDEWEKLPFFPSEGRESLKLSEILSWSVISLSFYSIMNEERIWEVILLYTFRIFVSNTLFGKAAIIKIPHTG